MNLVAILAAMFQSFNTLFNKGLMTTKTYWQEVAMLVPSSGEQENYAWLGDFPMLREWIGERAVKELSEYEYSIKNKKFESTVRVAADRIADDSFGIYGPMMQKLGESAGQWPDTMVFPCLADGFSTAGFDGKTFFATDHTVGTGGKKQKFSNRSNKPLSLGAYEEARSTLMSYCNDEGIPLGIVPNLLVVPPSLEGVARKILKNEFIDDGGVTVSNPWKDTAEILVVPQLANHPKKWFLLQTNGVLKPLIWQVRQEPEFQGMTDPNSENVFKKDEFLYGVKARGNVGFGFWQQAFGSTGA